MRALALRVRGHGAEVHFFQVPKCESYQNASRETFLMVWTASPNGIKVPRTWSQAWIKVHLLHQANETCFISASNPYAEHFKRSLSNREVAYVFGWSERTVRRMAEGDDRLPTAFLKHELEQTRRRPVPEFEKQAFQLESFFAASYASLLKGVRTVLR